MRLSRPGKNENYRKNSSKQWHSMLHTTLNTSAGKEIITLILQKHWWISVFHCFLLYNDTKADCTAGSSHVSVGGYKFIRSSFILNFLVGWFDNLYIIWLPVTVMGTCKCIMKEKASVLALARGHWITINSDYFKNSTSNSSSRLNKPTLDYKKESDKFFLPFPLLLLTNIAFVKQYKVDYIYCIDNFFCRHCKQHCIIGNQ